MDDLLEDDAEDEVQLDHFAIVTTISVQNELIKGMTLVFEGIAETTTDSATRHAALQAHDSINECSELLDAILASQNATKH